MRRCVYIFKNDVQNQVGVDALRLLHQVLQVSPEALSGGGGASSTPASQGSSPLDVEALGDELMNQFKVRHSKLTNGQQSWLLKVVTQTAGGGGPAEKCYRILPECCLPASLGK